MKIRCLIPAAGLLSWEKAVIAAPPAKDFWDKLDAASAIISGIVVALIGWYATAFFDRRQKEAESKRREREVAIAKVQTVEKFLPHLGGQNEEMKRAALIAINALGDSQLAADLSNAFGGPGATRALTDIAANSAVPGSAEASEALLSILAPLQERVAALIVDDMRRATAFLVAPGRLVTTAHALPGNMETEVSVELGGRRLDARIMFKDERRDLALLVVEGADELNAITLARGNPLVGENVSALQIATDGSRTIAFGQFLGVAEAPHYTTGRLLITTVNTFPGVSGAPIVNRDGELIGVMHSRDSQGRSLSVPVTALFDFVGQAPKR